MDTFLEVVQHVIAGTHGESHDRHRGGFVSTTWKNTGIADVEIGNVMGLRPFVRKVLFGIVTESADARLMQTGAWAVGFIVSAPEFSAHGLEQIDHHLLAVLPHEKVVISPLEMKTKLRNSEDVLLVGIDVDVVGRAGE